MCQWQWQTQPNENSLPRYFSPLGLSSTEKNREETMDQRSWSEACEGASRHIIDYWELMSPIYLMRCDSSYSHSHVSHQDNIILYVCQKRVLVMIFSLTKMSCIQCQARYVDNIHWFDNVCVTIVRSLSLLIEVISTYIYILHVNLSGKWILRWKSQYLYHVSASLWVDWAEGLGAHMYVLKF